VLPDLNPVKVRMNSLVYTISLPLAVLLGFTAHRAGLCMVRTVAEIISTRKAYMLVTILKTVLWVMAVSVSIFLFLPDAAAPNQSSAITAAAIIGGFLFGVGAAVNGGCALSTLGHLANGNIWMLTTIFGFCSGVTGLSTMAPHTNLASPPYRRGVYGCRSRDDSRRQ